MEDSSGKKKISRGEAVTTEISRGSSDLNALSVEELNTLLIEVVEQEDFLKAIAIRDEINKRKSR